MCGIAGAFGRDALDPARRSAALASLARRGPDAEGSYSTVLRGHALTLCHTRLAIIDLDLRSNQPFVRGDLALTFNGEIYNYREIRSELESLGHTFTTQSDTEVLLEAYRAWGPGCVDRFEGMWAFALADLAKGTLLLSRDRFGEKPLYFARRGGTLYFASEVKAVAALMGQSPTPNLAHLRRYLVNGYRALFKHPDTFFEGIEALPAASLAVVASPTEVTPQRYWNLRYAPRAMSLAEARDGAREHLERATALRLRADVPIALCLSGGVDSSALAAIAVKRFGASIRTFSIIDGDPRYDESDNIAATVADLGCPHVEIRTSTDGFLERMRDLVAYHDGPVTTIPYYIHDLLSEAVHKAGYKVVLGGIAADELFTGYYDHYNFWMAEMLAGGADRETLTRDWRASYGAYVQNPVLRDPFVFAGSPGERGHIYLNRDVFNGLLVEPEPEDFFEEPYSSNPLRNRMLNELFNEVVPPILLDLDLNSMRWSVENRSPYLDRQLAEFLYTVPNEHLIRDGYAKALLRDAVAGVLTDKPRLDKRKRGFNASIESFVDRRDPKVREQLLSPGPIFDLVRRDAVEAFLTNDMTDNSFSKFLFSFVSAKLFLEHAATPLRAAA